MTARLRDVKSLKSDVRDCGGRRMEGWRVSVDPDCLRRWFMNEIKAGDEVGGEVGRGRGLLTTSKMRSPSRSRAA